MSTDRRQARVLRRELHSPKSALAIVLALIAIVALAWIGTESVLAALGRPALLLSPSAMAAGVRGLAGVSGTLLLTAGVVLAVVGLVLVIAAVTPGRRGRHIIDAGRAAAVVDDEVIGSALVRAAAAQAAMSPDRAVASVGKRTATVRITPVSGVQLDRSALDSAVAREVDAMGVHPAIRARVTVDRRGKVGG